MEDTDSDTESVNPELLFAPLAKLIELKFQHMKTLRNFCREHLEKQVLLSNTSGEDRALISHEIMELDAKIDEAMPPLAFRTVCEPGSEEQWRYIKAAQYSDEWFLFRLLMQHELSAKPQPCIPSCCLV